MSTLDTLANDELRTVLDDPLALDDLDNGPTLVALLPAQTFVRIARQLRDESRLDLLLPFATPDQLTSLLDLDGWTQERLDIARSREWIHAISEAYTHDDRPRGALVDLMYAMDPELWTLVVGVGMLVLELTPGEDDAIDLAGTAMAHLRTWETPDGFFMVGVPDDELGRAALRTLLRIYQDSLGEGRKLCLAIGGLLPSQTEEECLRWRAGRLADLGFVAWEEAMRLFRPVDHRAAAQRPAAEHPAAPPSDAVDTSFQWSGPDLLRRIMARLPAAQHGVRSREFLLLVNEVMAAQRFDPGDQKLQERAIGQTQATLTLSLELLASVHAEAAPINEDAREQFLADRIVALGLRQVFQVGYGALDKLRKAALSLHTQGRVSLSSPGSLLDRPWGPAVASFCRWYPELPLPNTSRGHRPLAHLADVTRATTLIAESGALAQLAFAAEGYGIDPAWLGRLDEPERVRLGDLVRTAIVHSNLPGQATAFAPLTPSDLQWAAANLVVSGRLTTSIRSEFAARCSALGVGPCQETLAANLLTRLEAELASLERDDDGNPVLTQLGGIVTIQSVSVWLKTRHGDA